MESAAVIGASVHEVQHMLAQHMPVVAAFTRGVGSPPSATPLVDSLTRLHADDSIPLPTAVTVFEFMRLSALATDGAAGPA